MFPILSMERRISFYPSACATGEILAGLFFDNEIGSGFRGG